MTKGERVDASSTWEISVLDRKRGKRKKVDYHTTYRKVSAKNMIRMVNVKGESLVKGGKCTTEKMSPRPRTVTPITVQMMTLIKAKLNQTDPFNLAFFACLTTIFYTAA